MKALGPGATLGILGGGQLARMMALEARRMGFRIAVLDRDPQGPAAEVADVFVKGSFADLEAAKELARKSDVLTLDTEHAPAKVLEPLEAITPLRPSARVMAIIQDRLEQRRFLAQEGLPQTPNAEVSDEESLRRSVEIVGFPCIFKTRREGYDGKGQRRATSLEELEAAWASLDKAPCVVEAFVEFEKEVSALLARDVEGNVRFFPVAENEHRRHILHTTRVPARISEWLEKEAQEIGAAIASALGHIGVMAVELFVTRDEKLLVNEIAPRTHNSGHYTFGACATSQFEQHVRAVAGLGLGDPSLLRPAVMVNLLGDLWQKGEPDWRVVFSRPEAKLHLYGKNDARPGRKMGHVLVLDEDPERAMAVVEELLRELEAERAG